MSELTNCLSTHTPRVLDLPPDVPRFKDPVRWAINLIEANPKVSDLQIMKWAQGDVTVNEDEFSILNATDPKDMNLFVHGVQTGKAVHGRLELLHVTVKALDPSPV